MVGREIVRRDLKGREGRMPSYPQSGYYRYSLNTIADGEVAAILCRFTLRKRESARLRALVYELIVVRRWQVL